MKDIQVVEVHIMIHYNRFFRIFEKVHLIWPHLSIKRYCGNWFKIDLEICKNEVTEVGDIRSS